MILREKANNFLDNKNNYLQEFPTLPILYPLNSYKLIEKLYCNDFLTKLQTRQLAFIKYQSNNASQMIFPNARHKSQLDEPPI